MSTWNPERNDKGKFPARPKCQTCKRLVVRVRCNECGKKLCHEDSRTKPGMDNYHACPDCVDQLLFPFVAGTQVSEARNSSTA